jgi:hypothetical protein
MPSAWDLRLALRAAGIAAIASLVTLLVVAATDAGGPWSSRLGMTAGLAPVAGALGALGAIRVAAGRGELRALAAIGAEPGRVVLGAAIGGAAVGLAGSLLGASGFADLAPLFPQPIAERAWIARDGGLCEAALGLCVDAGGMLSIAAAHPARAASAIPATARPLAALALGAAALSCPAWIAAPEAGPLARRTAVGAAAVAAAIVGFQAVAAGRAPPAVLGAAPLILVIDTAIARYLARR